MEQLIRKILNYDFENITYLQRLKLAKEILRHFENEIPNKTSYNKPKLHLLIDEFNEHKESISVDNKILLKTNAFTNNDGQSLFEDMHTIAHECYHGGQHGMVQTKNKDSSSPIFNFVPDHYQEIFLRYKLKIYEGNKKINTYKIILQCYYPLEVNFYDFLFGYNPDSENYFFDIEIIAINDKISYKQISEEW